MTRSLLPASWEIPERIRNRLGRSVGRQRVMSHEGHLLLVLHAPPRPDEEERRGRFLWRDPHGNWRATEFGSGIQALARHVEEYEELLAQLDQQEEGASGADQYFRVLEALAPVHRSARHLHMVLQEARKLCPEDTGILDTRDRAYALERNAELLHGETKNALDYMLAKRVEQQAESSRYMEVTAHRLNMLVAFFFPIATLTTVFGTNLRHGFERQHAPYPFLAMIGVGLLLGIMLTVFVRRRHRAAPRR